MLPQEAYGCQVPCKDSFRHRVSPTQCIKFFSCPNPGESEKIINAMSFQHLLTDQRSFDIVQCRPCTNRFHGYHWQPPQGNFPPRVA